MKLKQTKVLETTTRRRGRMKNKSVEHVTKDSFMCENLQKKDLAEDDGMKCHKSNNSTEVIEHQGNSTNNSDQLEKSFSHCKGIENQSQDDCHSEPVLEHSGRQCESNGKQIDYTKTQSVSEEVEHCMPNPNLCEEVECLEQNQSHSDGMEVTEQSVDYSKGIEHPNEYANDEVEHPDQNQNLKEGKDQEQSQNHSEGLDNSKQTRRSKNRTRSKSSIEKIQQLDPYGIEQTKQTTNDINEEINEQRNEEDPSSSTLHTNGNDGENLQDNNSRETRKTNKPYTCHHCPKRFRMKCDFVKHLRAHTKEKTLSCPQCYRPCETDKQLSIHVIGHRTTSKVGPYISPHCSKEFNSKFSWQRHVFDHEREDSEYVQACHACKMCFRSERTFTRHRYKFHRDEMMKERNEMKELEAKKKSDKHVCPYCNKEVRKKRWNMHLKIHKEGRERNFLCSHCDKAFFDKHNLAKHELVHIDRDRAFACHHCKRSFLLKCHLDVHLENCLKTLITRRSSESLGHICPTCKRGYSSEKRLNTHMQIHEKKRSKFLCSVCSKGFLYKRSRSRHEISFHKTIIPTVKKNSYRCKICQQLFVSKKNLIRHKVVHIERNYACNVCRRKYISEDELKKHEVYHSTRHLLTSNTCIECKTNFDSVDALKEHRLVHFKEQTDKLNSLEMIGNTGGSNNVFQNGESSKNNSTTKTNASEEVHLLYCSICQKKFANKGNLTRHIMNLHSGERKLNSNMTKTNTSEEKHPFYCSICQRKFSNIRNLSKHMKLHSGEENIFTCPLSTCQKTFTQSRYLTKHMKVHSGKRKMFTCHICDNCFPTKNNLEAHIKSHTDIEEAYLCSECLNIFASRASLKEHIEAVHAKEKLYPCPLCPMKFAYKNIMQKHFLSHREEEVLSCPHCPKYFESQDDMNWHIIRSHKDIVHKFSYKDEFYYNLRILEEDPKNIDKKEPDSTTNAKSKMEKKNQNPTGSEWLRNMSIDKENSLQECSIMLKYQYTYSGMDDTPLTLWL